MSVIAHTTSAASIVEPSARRLPSLKLRQRTNDHPMAMFAILVATTFAALALMPSTHSAFASTGTSSHDTITADGVRTTQKTGRLVPATEADRICEGQTWGNESLECLLEIAREGGQTREIRMIADATPDRNAPNVF